MDNLEREILGEVQEGFVINDDVKADWALEIIKAEKADCERLVSLCESKIQDLQTKIKDYKSKYENSTSYLKSQLQTYFQTVERKTTKTQETYKLPSGTLKKKYGAYNYIREDETFIKWLKNNGYTDKVKTVEAPDWQEFKKNLIIDNDKVITTDGEVVEGVKVELKPDTFNVEV